MKKIFAAAALLLAMTACGGAKEGKTLESNVWKLTSMEGIPASAIASEADAFTLLFDAADTLVAGRTNCNRFFGKYMTKGTALTFGDLGMTRMACPDMEYEQTFVEMLSKVNHFEIKGEELKLLSEQTTLAVFRAEEPAAEQAAAPAQGEPQLIGTVDSAAMNDAALETPQTEGTSEN